MTAAVTPTTSTAAPRPGSRILAVVKLHLVDRWNYIIVPWLVTGAALVISILITIIINQATSGEAIQADGFSEGVQYSGAGQAVFWYLLVVAIQTINLSLPFALGLSATRREFLAGTGVLFLGISLVNSALYTLLSALEEGTTGWWAGTRMFTSLALHDVSLGGRFVFYTALHLFVLTFGAAMASVFFRWKAAGTTVTIIGLVFVLVGLAALVTVTDGWPSVGRWFLESGPVGVALWTLPATGIGALITWGLLRRATPKG